MAVYDATRLKTGRGNHATMVVSAGSPTKDGSASSATGQYIETGSYCKVVSDGSGGLKLANITDSRSTPTSGDNAYLAKSIIFNFSADTMTDKWENTLSTVSVITDVIPDGQAVAAPYEYTIEYSNGSDTVVTADNPVLWIAPDAVEITKVDVMADNWDGAQATAQVQIFKDSTAILSTAITVTSVLQSGTMNDDSKLLTAGQMLSISVHDGTWTGISQLNTTISYKYR